MIGDKEQLVSSDPTCFHIRKIPLAWRQNAQKKLGDLFCPNLTTLGLGTLHSVYARLSIILCKACFSPVYNVR